MGKFLIGRNNLAKFLFLGYVLVASCKKNISPDGPVTPGGSSQKTVHLGLTPMTEADLVGKTFVESLDTSKNPVFEAGRINVPDYWTINVPPPRGEQDYNDCAAWALGYGLMGYYYHKDEGITGYDLVDSLFAPNSIYNPLNGGKDNGIKMTDALNFAQEKGCSRWKYMPYNQYTYLSPVPAPAKENALNYLISEWHPFKTVNIELIKKYVSKNYPILFGCYIYESLAYTEKCISCRTATDDFRHVYTKNEGDKLKGHHAMLICGYDDGINAFKVLNSWGADKGDFGYFWIDYDYFKSIVVQNLFGVEIYLALPRQVFTRDATTVTKNSGEVAGFIVADNEVPFFERGICYGTTTGPTVNDAKMALGAGLGKFSGKLFNLLPAKKYYVRAYGINNKGTVYGNEISFTTIAENTELISTVIPIGQITSAVSGGIIGNAVNGAITSRGICWGTSPAPVIEGNSNKTVDGLGTGTFESKIQGLSPQTKYYVRAYAVTGSGVIYGNEKQLVTATTMFNVSKYNYFIYQDNKWQQLTGGGEEIKLYLSFNNGIITGSALVYGSTGSYMYTYVPVKGLLSGTSFNLTIEGETGLRTVPNSANHLVNGIFKNYLDGNISIDKKKMTGTFLEDAKYENTTTTNGNYIISYLYKGQIASY